MIDDDSDFDIREVREERKVEEQVEELSSGDDFVERTQNYSSKRARLSKLENKKKQKNSRRFQHLDLKELRQA